VDAGWKFWKKKKDEPTSTVEPMSMSSTSSPSPGPTTKSPSQGPKGPPSNANKAISAASNPALAIGAGNVGNVGGKIHDDARNQPRKPNPGTAVGLDGPPSSKPDAGNNYRNSAVEFGGAGGGSGDKSKLPGQTPTSVSDTRTPNAGSFDLLLSSRADALLLFHLLPFHHFTRESSSQSTQWRKRLGNLLPITIVTINAIDSPFDASFFHQRLLWQIYFTPDPKYLSPLPILPAFDVLDPFQ
jgi:hypothetical protein